MKNLLRAIIGLAEVINLLVASYKRRQLRKKIEEIRDDPAAEFEREFGGVRDDKADLPGGEAGAEVNRDK